ncbi:DNRLRE domain-containing protein [Streptomyces sp. NPDC015532]|uniref:DNRLRE domain-containing protein n=1 Tax=Streptomyces sp. NPDC015532 TaxID=3364960 RepID=UPI0036F8CFD6
MRQIAIGLVMAMVAEGALVAESGMAFATTPDSGASTASAAPASEAPSGPAEAQDEASAVLMARLQDRKIEVLSERTTKSTTYVLPSGAMQTVSYGGPIRVKQDGQWKDIDTSLSDTGDSLEPKAAAADVAVSDGGDTQLASVSKDKASFGLGWEDKLPTPSVKDGTASYNLGDGQKLSVTALAQGFSENIQLSQQPADDAGTYRIPLNLDGLKLSQADSGHLLLKNPDGDLVAEAPAPMMWDDSKDPASGESAHQRRVDTKIDTDKDGSQTLVLSADKDFLATATYPVTIDPTSTLAVTTDTWVQTPDYTDSQVSSPELKSGTYDGGTDVARSYLKFDVSPYKGKHIIDTNLALYSYYSATCATTGAGTQVRRITSDWSSSTVTWAAQPTTTTTGAVTNTAALGYSSACPAGTMNFDLDSIVQAWADGSANYGLQVRGASETDSATWRRFRSANYISGDNSVEPHLTVTYNSYATNSASAVSPSIANAYNGKRYVTSLTPLLSAKVSDADGGTVKAQFEVTPDPAYNDTTYAYTATTAAVASGGTAKLTIPSANAFPAGSHLRFRARGFDDSDYGTWSGYSVFVLNTALPVAPSISCPDYPVSTWSAKASGAVSCTLDTTSTDGQGFKWGLDDPAMGKRVDDTVDGTGGDPLTISITPADGWHTLYAKTIDSGGNLSTATTQYAFGVGADGAAILSPGQGDRPARRVALSATGKSTYTGVTYQYRRGETDTWHNVPLADVAKNSDGSAVAAWPLAAPSGAPPALNWNITTSLAEDGPVDIRAAFTDGTSTGYSEIVTVTADRNAGDAPASDVGPGSVNELTGDYTLSATDASLFGMSVSRTASSRRPTAGTDAEGQVAIFGPQWTSGAAVQTSDSDWDYLRKTSATSVAVVDSEGIETGFTATSAGAWQPEPGAEDLALTGSLTGSFTLKDDQGTTTTFAKVDPAATTWQMSTTFTPLSDSTTTVVSEKVVAGSSTLTRPKYLIAPTSAVSASQCQTAIDAATAAGHDWFANTSSNTGCRVLQFVYAASTTATSSVFGNYTGQVQQIKLWAVTPGDSTTTATVVSQYAYDNSSRLREEWDPRISPALKATYAYDSAGRVTTLTPAGELPWTFAYGTAGNAATAGPGMLLSTSRPTLSPGSKSQQDGGTAAVSLVYDVPLSGSTAPYKMGTSNVSAWGQTDMPTDATAVFPEDVAPASHDGKSLTSASYTRASLSYADASGREVNAVTPGGYVTTTEYDGTGNVLRELTAANRELALATSGAGLDEINRLGISGLSTAERADQLSTTHVYSTDGQRELQEYGPLHMVTLTGTIKAGTGGTDLPAGSEVAARRHTATAYDEGRPTDGSATVSNQPTTATIGAYVDGYPSDADTRTTKTGYDWVQGLPTTSTLDPAGLAVTQTTVYDTKGRTIKSIMPKSNGSDAGTTATTYWSATGTGTCQGRPEWADMVCSVGPAGAITGGGTNPAQLATKSLEYDRWGNLSKETRTANGATRTTAFTVDGAGRTTKIAIAGGVGTAVADTTAAYDTVTGDVTTVTSGGQTVTRTYDMLGRDLSYNDGAGNVRNTVYDKLNRPVKTTDSAPSTITYTYDTSTDPRGLETSRTDSVAGTFRAAYDANGGMTSEQIPGGYTLTVGTNEIGTQTSRVYTRDSDGSTVASDAADHSVQDQVVADSDTNGQTVSRAYGYDQIGRLTRSDNASPNGTCTRRDYGFDKDSNRTTQAVSSGAPGDACSSTGATSTTNTYDSADRLTNTGTVYDAFGRTTAKANGTTLSYYATDLIRQQTSSTGRQTWSLDALGRLSSSVTETQNSDSTWSQTAVRTDHHGDDTDSPDWSVVDASGTVSRNVQGIDGSLAAVTGASGATVLQLADIAGNVTVQLPLDQSGTVVAQSFDEFGNPESGAAPTSYGFRGATLRNSGTVSGDIVMGVRLYDPSTGRFLQTDPVPGGSANAYDYAGQDPLNQQDDSGTSSKCKCTSSNNYWRQTSVGHVHWGRWHDTYSQWMKSWFKRNAINAFNYIFAGYSFGSLRVKIVGMKTRYGYQNWYFRRCYRGRWQHEKETYYWYVAKGTVEITAIYFLTWRRTLYDGPYMYDARISYY